LCVPHVHVTVQGGIFQAARDPSAPVWSGVRELLAAAQKKKGWNNSAAFLPENTSMEDLKRAHEEALEHNATLDEFRDWLTLKEFQVPSRRPSRLLAHCVN